MIDLQSSIDQSSESVIEGEGSAPRMSVGELSPKIVCDESESRSVNAESEPAGHNTTESQMLSIREAFSVTIR